MLGDKSKMWIFLPKSICPYNNPIIKHVKYTKCFLCKPTRLGFAAPKKWGQLNNYVYYIYRVIIFVMFSRAAFIINKSYNITNK